MTSSSQAESRLLRVPYTFSASKGLLFFPHCHLLNVGISPYGHKMLVTAPSLMEFYINAAGDEKEVFLCLGLDVRKIFLKIPLAESPRHLIGQTWLTCLLLK